MKYQRELEVAVTAVRQACGVCRAVQADLVNAGTLEKKDKSPVTVADFAAQAVVCHTLSQALPGARVVGEEDSRELREDAAADLRKQVAQRAQLDEATMLAAIDVGGYTPETPGELGTYWTLDPIDGTKGFLRGEQYAVALALLEAGQVVLGVLGCPNLDGGLLLVATAGGGVRRLTLDGDDVQGQPLDRPDGAMHPSDVRFCESVESGHSDQDASVAIARTLGITAEPYRIDSQCKYAAVAMGHAQIYLRLPTRPGYREKIWDHAAGMLCVVEAGGTVTDVHGQGLDFTRGRALEDNQGIIATRGVDHGHVVAAVKQNLSV